MFSDMPRPSQGGEKKLEIKRIDFLAENGLDIYGAIYPDNSKYTTVKYTLEFHYASIPTNYYIRLDYLYQGSWTYSPLPTTAGENTVTLNPLWDDVYLVFYGKSSHTYGRITVKDIEMS